jgi:hypothetical protein
MPIHASYEDDFTLRKRSVSKLYCWGVTLNHLLQQVLVLSKSKSGGAHKYYEQIYPSM